MRLSLTFIACCGAWICTGQFAVAQESPFNDFCVQCSRGDLQTVTETLNSKPEFATTSDKPLVNAAENGRVDVVKLLLARGATQNARTRALHLAVTHMYVPNPDSFSRLKEVIALLLAGGANPVDPSKHKGFTDFVDLSISSSDPREDAQLSQRRREIRAIFANAKVLKAEQEMIAKAEAEAKAEQKHDSEIAQAPIYKLKDGTQIKALRTIDGGDAVTIKDDKGKLHTINKSDIAEVIQTTK